MFSLSFIIHSDFVFSKQSKILLFHLDVFDGNALCGFTTVNRNLNSRLKWSLRIEASCGKAIGALFAVKSNTSPRLSITAKLFIYCGYIMPIMTYGRQVWYANKGDSTVIDYFNLITLIT